MYQLNIKKEGVSTMKKTRNEFKKRIIQDSIVIILIVFLYFVFDGFTFKNTYYDLTFIYSVVGVSFAFRLLFDLNKFKNK